MFVRTGFTFYLHYNKGVTPFSDFTWTYPLRLAAWEIVLDYFFVSQARLYLHAHPYSSRCGRAARRSADL